MPYFVYYTWGSTLSGDRTAGLGEYDGCEEAMQEVEEIMEEHTDAQVIVIAGEEVYRA